MNSRQRVAAALDHREPDRVPLDLGASAVTGMHVSSVYQLRQALGLDPPGTPVKVVEPYQMLGEIAPGPAWTRWAWTWSGWAAARRCSASATRTGSRGPLFDGTPVLVPGGVQHRAGAERRHPDVSRGRPLGAAQRPHAQGRLLLRHHHPPGADRRRQAERRGQPRGVRPDLRRRRWRTSPREADRLYDARPTRRSWPTSAARPSATSPWCPAPWLKHPQGHPRRRRVVHEHGQPAATTSTRSSSASARSRWRTWRRSTTPSATGWRRCSSPAPTSARSTGPFIRPTAYRELFQPFHRRVNDWVHAHTPWKTFIHSCGSVIALLPDFIEAGLRHPQPGAVLGRRHGPAGAEGRGSATRSPSGAAAWTRRRRCPSARPTRSAREVARADRDLRPRRRLRVQHDPQRPGERAGREPGGAVRGGAQDARTGSAAVTGTVTPPCSARPRLSSACSKRRRNCRARRAVGRRMRPVPG